MSGSQFLRPGKVIRRAKPFRRSKERTQKHLLNCRQAWHDYGAQAGRPPFPNHSSSSSQPSTWLPGWAPHHLCYLHGYCHVCGNKKLVSQSELHLRASRGRGAQGGTGLPRSSGIFSERLGSFSLKLLCFLFSPFAPLLSMVWCPRRVQEQTPAGPSKGHIPHCLCCSLQLAYMDPLIACMSFRLFSMHELSAKPCWKHWNFTFFMEIFHIKWAVSHFPWNS